MAILGEYRMLFNTLMNYRNLQPAPMPEPMQSERKTAPAE